MDEILRLIRLLVEAPAEEPMLERPAELRDRILLDEASRSTAAQVAGTPAQPIPPVNNTGPTANVSPTMIAVGPLAVPAAHQGDFGAEANLKTGVPQVAYVATVKPLEADPGRRATPASTDPNSDAPARLFEPGVSDSPRATGKVQSPETGPPAILRDPQQFVASAATPALIKAVTSAPASIRENAVEATVQATPKTNVTIIAPQAFPIDMEAAFADADESLPSEVVGGKEHKLNWQLPPFHVPETTPEYSSRVYDEQSFTDLRRST